MTQKSTFPQRRQHQQQNGMSRVCVYAMPLLGSQGYRTVLETMGQDKRALLIILIKSISVLRSDLCCVCVTSRVCPTGQKEPQRAENNLQKHKKII